MRAALAQLRFQRSPREEERIRLCWAAPVTASPARDQVPAMEFCKRILLSVVTKDWMSD